MKLGDIYSICKRNYNVIKSIDGSMMNLMDYDDELTKKVKTSGDEIKKIECLKDAYLNLEKCLEKCLEKVEDLIFEEADKTSLLELQNAKEKMLSMMDGIIGIYEETGLQKKEMIGIDIKFPVSGNFSDFRKDIDELDFIFTKCPFFQDEKESLRFDNVDIGSFWLTFVVIGAAITGGSILLNNIAAFVDKCIIIRSHYLTVQQQKANMEKAQVEEKEKEEVIKGFNRYYKIVVDNAIKELEEITNCKLQDGDERGRVEQSFEKMGKLIDKGMQIYATIDSPKEAKVLFEPLEMHYLDVSSKLKLLEDKKEEEK